MKSAARFSSVYSCVHWKSRA